MHDEHECLNSVETSSEGDSEVRNQFALIYEELRVLASRYMANSPFDSSLQSTALVHEACLRLMNNKDLQWNDRDHLLAIAAQAMRCVLKDEARRHSAEKRGGDYKRVTLAEGINQSQSRDVDIIMFSDVLDRLESFHDRHCRVVELRFLGGMSFEEIGRFLDISARTAERDWRTARAWLAYQFQGD